MVAGHKTSSCDGKCGRLLTKEWLALKAHWKESAGEEIQALHDTTLKKSELNSKDLPAAVRMSTQPLRVM